MVGWKVTCIAAVALYCVFVNRVVSAENFPNASSWTCDSLKVTDRLNHVYDVTNAVETNLDANALNVTGVVCSKGYKGTVKVSPCSRQVEEKRVCKSVKKYERDALIC